jgi:hypothetical protein
VISVVDDWWNGRHIADKLPRLFFELFTDTSFAPARCPRFDLRVAVVLQVIRFLRSV